jgi:hypothetical protein
MADFDSYASPRSYSRHRRYNHRLRHGKQLEEFLTVQATRLSTTTAEILTLLHSYTADQIRASATLAAVEALPVGSH